MGTRFVGLLAALVVTGCASLTPEQEHSAGEIRAMVTATARAYRVPEVYVLVGRDVDWIGGSYRRGMITVSTPMLRSRHRDALVAHELAHYLLDHDRPLRGATQLDMEREQEERELDANVKAVEVLARARGLTEAHALSRVYDTILSFYRAVTLNGAVVPGGHRPPCREIADLLARFPQHRHWTARLECADGVPAPVPAVALAPGAERDSAWFEQAYLSDGLPEVALPPPVQRFHPSRDRTVTLVLRPRPGADGRTVVSRWIDAAGIERRQVASHLAAGAHAVPMWELRPWPGRWIVRASVDGRPAGEFPFTID